MGMWLWYYCTRVCVPHRHCTIWDDHISQMFTWGTRGINLLCKIAWFLPRDILCCYYNAYILPFFTYADSVWCTCTRAHSNRLERLQSYAARIILYGQRKTSATSMCQELGWPTLPLGGDWMRPCMQIFKCVSGLSPAYHTDLMKPVSSVRVYETRSATTNGLSVPQPGTEFGRKSFRFWGPHNWNSLPTELRKTRGYLNFRAALCTFARIYSLFKLNYIYHLFPIVNYTELV